MRRIKHKLLALGIASLSFPAFSCDTCSHEKAQIKSNSTQVKIEDACFAYGAHEDPKHQGSILVLQYYFDPSQDAIVGAFVRVNEAKKTIPLIFKEAVFDNKETPALGDFQVTWLEAINNKITGSYKLVQTGGGARQGRYLEYRNFLSRSKYTLSSLGDAKDCKSLFGRWNTKASPLRILN